MKIAFAGFGLLALAGCEASGDTTSSPLTVADRSGYCVGAAARHYAVQPQNVALGAQYRFGNGIAYDGTVNQAGQGISKFRCEFDSSSDFQRITPVTPDGRSASGDATPIGQRGDLPAQ